MSAAEFPVCGRAQDDALEETFDLLSTPGALEQIRQAEADIASGQAIDAVELRRKLTARVQREQR